MNDKELMGQKIKTLRSSKQLTQEKFAELIDLSVRQMGKIETGKCYPSLETLKKIAGLFDLTLDVLLDTDYYDEPEVLRAKIHDKVDKINETQLRLLYRVASSLD